MFSIGQEGQYLLEQQPLLAGICNSPSLQFCTRWDHDSCHAGWRVWWILAFSRSSWGKRITGDDMLNSIAALIIEYLVQFPMRADTSALRILQSLMNLHN